MGAAGFSAWGGARCLGYLAPPPLPGNPPPRTNPPRTFEASRGLLFGGAPYVTPFGAPAPGDSYQRGVWGPVQVADRTQTALQLPLFNHRHPPKPPKQPPGCARHCGVQGRQGAAGPPLIPYLITNPPHLIKPAAARHCRLRGRQGPPGLHDSPKHPHFNPNPPQTTPQTPSCGAPLPSTRPARRCWPT